MNTLPPTQIPICPFNRLFLIKIIFFIRVFIFSLNALSNAKESRT